MFFFFCIFAWWRCGFYVKQPLLVSQLLFCHVGQCYCLQVFWHAVDSLPNTGTDQSCFPMFGVLYRVCPDSGYANRPRCVFTFPLQSCPVLQHVLWSSQLLSGTLVAIFIINVFLALYKTCIQQWYWKLFLVSIIGYLCFHRCIVLCLLMYLFIELTFWNDL